MITKILWKNQTIQYISWIIKLTMDSLISTVINIRSLWCKVPFFNISNGWNNKITEKLKNRPSLECDITNVIFTFINAIIQWNLAITCFIWEKSVYKHDTLYIYTCMSEGYLTILRSQTMAFNGHCVMLCTQDMPYNIPSAMSSVICVCKWWNGYI